ncbi:secreted antigen 1 [Babesia caballi]|uniref:Secreted antigen 1 n=1 Tax=Babesia caballi TaxID=5871 RepID=A0AAV4LMD2_BABCB|nr:secreted antigen 1 [Babesia caballi]
MFDCWDLDGDFRTLKECLDYFGWLNSQRELQQYLDAEIRKVDPYIRSTQNNLTANLSSVISKIDKFRKLLYFSTENYGKYTNRTFSEGCDGGHIYNLNVCLHRLYSALLFLWFNTSGTEKDRGGSGWSDSSCNASNSEICKWLIGENEGPGIIKGGFSISDLKGTKGKQIASEIEKALNSNDLQKCLSTLLFLPPWLPEKTANACLLVKQLCEMMSNDRPVEELTQEYSNDYDNIKQICKELMQSVGKITNGIGDKLLSPVYKDSNNIPQYNVEEQFSLCFAFFKECLPELIESLGHMKEQCIDWTAENIKNARTPGPFLYGFSFTDKYKPVNSGLEGQSQFTETICQVVQSLNELNEILNPTSHAVAIGLGVVSSLLVGGSAAAAYFYPGLLSSTINMVVG